MNAIGRCCLLLALLALLTACAPVPPSPDALPSGDPLPDDPWAALAVSDLEALRDLIRDNHPGARDDENPAFARWLEEGFGRAREQAEQVRGYSGYLFTLRAFVNGFRDGNLQLVPGLQRRFFVWPGFLIAYDGKAYRVAAVDDKATAAPVIGSRLVSCDGVPAATLANTLVAPYFGNWQLEAERRRFAPYLLIDRGNPFVARPKRCRFDEDGASTELDLAWGGIGADELTARITSARTRIRPPNGIHSIGNGGFWISLSRIATTGDGVAASEARASLGQLLEDIDAQLRAIRRAALLIIDLRGNSGGDSSWGEQVIRRIWGERYLEALRPATAAVDWRVSAGNAGDLATWEETLTKSFGAGSEQVAWARRVAAGVRAALGAAEVFWRETPAVSPGSKRRPGKSPLRAQVFVVTDGACAGACLEIAGLLLAFDGTTHVGLPTSGETVYASVRSETLPSGLADLSFAMKVHRARPRGHNQPYVPAQRFSGRMDDTAALEAWILTLGRGES